MRRVEVGGGGGRCQEVHRNLSLRICARHHHDLRRHRALQTRGGVRGATAQALLNLNHHVAHTLSTAFATSEAGFDLSLSICSPKVAWVTTTRCWARATRSLVRHPIVSSTFLVVLICMLLEFCYGDFLRNVKPHCAANVASVSDRSRMSAALARSSRVALHHFPTGVHV